MTSQETAMRLARSCGGPGVRSAAANSPPAQPTGACCLPPGFCVVVTEAICVAHGGTYQGNGTACATVMCPRPMGACCLPNGTCEQRTREDCFHAGGIYRGNGVQCSGANCPAPTPSGSCCLANGF